MKIPNFSPDRRIYDYFPYWHAVENGTKEPDEYQAAMMKLVEQAEAEGVFYQRDLESWMSKRTPFIPENVRAMTTNTEGGVFGMECYMAAVSLREISRRARNLEAARLYAPGDKIGVLSVNGKKVSGITVEKVEGQTIFCRGTTGRYGCTFTTEAGNIEGMKERAVQRKWRKHDNA